MLKIDLSRKLVMALLLFTLIPFQGIAQETGLGEPHNSKFKNLKTGVFLGTINGVLSIKHEDSTQLILDFQGSKAELDIEHDQDETYDVSTKTFCGQSTSGKTKIEYRFYAGANEFYIHLSNQVYKAGIIDGAADLVIMGLSYSYFVENGMEYLSLYFEKDIKFHSQANREKFINVQKGSTLVFAIKG